MGEELCNILKVADKHPKSRMAKLIHIVQEEPNEKNITMLIIEMAEHNEFSVDFNLSLKYYIDLFERQCLGHDIIFNEAGLFLANSSKIYARRVDWVQSRVEQQILSLSNSEKELEKESNEQESDENVKATEADKSCAKRGRKRVLEVSTNEIEGSTKKTHKLMPDKRFSSPDQSSLNSSQSKLDAYARLDMEQHLHPPSSLHGTIYDLVNDRDIYKRNYKMFAYHVDHRYNTLVPDINFHLHFQMKDFIDEEDEACHTERRQWPPLSKAYIKQYTELEDRILGQTLSRKSTVQNAKHSSNLTSSEVRETEESAINSIGCASRGESSPLPSNSVLSETQNENEALSGTLNESSVQITDKDISTEQTPNASSTLTHSQNESSESEGYQSLNNSLEDKSQRNDNDVSKNQQNDKTQNHSKDRSEDLVGEKIDLGGIRVHLPHLDDEGVCFSDLDEIDQKMLSPKVVATDILPCVPNKENITIVIDEEIRSLLRIERDTTETTPSPSPPPPNTPTPPQITLNICKLPERLIRKRAFFKLGPEMDLHMKARFFKRLRLSNEATIRQRRQLQRFPLNDTDPTNVQITPCSSPDFCGFSDYSDSEDEIDMNFLGFDESEKERDGCSNDTIHRLSRDSGVGVEGSVTTQHNSNTLSDSSLSELKKQKECDSQGVEIDNPPGDNTSNSTLGDSANPANVAMANSMGHDNDTDNDTDNTKVQEWYDYLRPILATSQERHHFDVFHLGTEIIEAIQNNSENKNIKEQLHHPEHNVNKSANPTPATASFMEIMQNRDESHVSRYFLATLLLINQNNLKLSLEDGRKNGEKPIDWEDMHLELQSTTRHTVAIEDNIGLLGKQENTGDRQLEGEEEQQQTHKLYKHSSKGDSNATYCKNLSMKKAFKESTNTSNSNSEAPINNSQSNENITSFGLIASTPLHKPCTSNSEFNVNWHAPRISDIMPLRLNMESMEEADESENELNGNSNHSYHHFNDPPCTSKQMIQMNERESLPPVRLKFIKPLPAIPKTHQQNETDSGIFSTDDYQSMS